MQIVFAADHGGYELKEQIKKWLSEKKGYKISDAGALEYKGLDGFTDYSQEAIERVLRGAVGIFVCGTGLLASMAANRNKGIRAALCHRVEYAVLAREHTDANVLCLGARFLTFDHAIKFLPLP